MNLPCKVYAIKTKGDYAGNESLVYEGKTQCNLSVLKEHLIYKSIEYDESLQLRCTILGELK